MSFGTRLRELREAAGLTRKELAERAGLKESGIANLEQDRRSPAWETVVALCTALNVSCDEFRKEPTAEPAPKPRGRPRKKAEGQAEGEPPA